MASTSSAQPDPSNDMACLGSLLSAADALDQKRQPAQLIEQAGKDKLDVFKSASSRVASASSPDNGSSNTTLRDFRGPVDASTNQYSSSSSSSLAHIPFDIMENDNYIRLRLHIVGVKASDIRVSIQRGILAVRGTRTLPCVSHDSDTILYQDQTEPKPGGSSGVLKSHRFCRRFSVDTDVVDVFKFRSRLSSSGLLTIVANKKNPHAPMNLQVEVIEGEDGNDMGNEVQLPLVGPPAPAPGVPLPHAFKRESHMISPGSSENINDGDEKKQKRLD